eukprot:TRINITY_DN1171_c0_g1_i1.p1 TRINITY_DN1171_c0_g1~~TRINITY_DN1171_c0_g1_i1.p1  ORF type:complete len:125 (+),score=22.09 TRINITY_DN1171_c0_g1_i1:570-944(+)
MEPRTRTSNLVRQGELKAEQFHSFNAYFFIVGCFVEVLHTLKKETLVGLAKLQSPSLPNFRKEDRIDDIHSASPKLFNALPCSTSMLNNHFELVEQTLGSKASQHTGENCQDPPESGNISDAQR